LKIPEVLAGGLKPSASVKTRLTKLPACAYQHFSADFRRLKQPGDGSCFFASWANAMFGDRYDATPDKNGIAHKMRDEVANVLTEQMYESTARRVQAAGRKMHREGKTPPPPPSPTYAEFQKKLRKYSTWADLIMIATVALRMHVNLYFFDEKNCTFYYGTDRNNAASRNKSMRWVFILWTDNHSHFDLIVRQKQPGGKIQHSFTLKNDGPTLTRLRASYESSAGKHTGKK
jgi:hypothetical protein